MQATAARRLRWMSMLRERANRAAGCVLAPSSPPASYGRTTSSPSASPRRLAVAQPYRTTRSVPNPHTSIVGCPRRKDASQPKPTCYGFTPVWSRNRSCAHRFLLHRQRKVQQHLCLAARARTRERRGKDAERRGWRCWVDSSQGCRAAQTHRLARGGALALLLQLTDHLGLFVLAHVLLQLVAGHHLLARPPQQRRLRVQNVRPQLRQERPSYACVVVSQSGARA